MLRLNTHREKGLWRARRINEQDAVSFCSNDYLGLAKDPAVIAAFVEGAQKYGVGSGASMMVSGYGVAHQNFERDMARFLRCEQALLFASGYMANLSIMQALMYFDDVVYQDRLNHASLLDSAKLSSAKSIRYRHCDLAHLEDLLKKPIAGQKWVVTDHVFSMTGEAAPLLALKALCVKYQARLVVDDAHGVGIFTDPIDADVLVTPLGKAFGGLGGVVSGSHEMIETLIQFARTYLFTTGLPPAMAVAMHKSLDLIEHEPWRREKLMANIAYFRSGALARGLPFHPSHAPIQVLLLGDNDQVMAIAAALFERGFWVGAIRPPAVPKNGALLRLTLSTAHTFDEIDGLLGALADLMERA